MANVSGKAFDYSLFKRVMVYVKPYRFIFYTTAVLSIVLSVFAMTRPLLVQITVDDYIKSLDSEGLFLMTMLLIGLLCVGRFFRLLFWLNMMWVHLSDSTNSTMEDRYLYFFTAPDIFHTLICGEYLYKGLMEMRRRQLDPWVAQMSLVV